MALGHPLESEPLRAEGKDEDMPQQGPSPVSSPDESGATSDPPCDPGTSPKAAALAPTTALSPAQSGGVSPARNLAESQQGFQAIINTLIDPNTRTAESVQVIHCKRGLMFVVLDPCIPTTEEEVEK